MKLEAADAEQHDPTVEMWLMYFLAQHNLYVKNFQKAFDFINEAI